MIKLATFYDHEEICRTPNGASYVTCTSARQQAEKFINKPNIKVIDIKYTNTNHGTSILVIYHEQNKKRRKYVKSSLPQV